MFTAIITETPFMFFGTPFNMSPIELLLIAAMYATIGMLLWERLFTKPVSGLAFDDDAVMALMAAEHYGSPNEAHANAHLLCKAFFVALWAPCLLFYAVCQIVLRTHYHLLSGRTRHVG
nr:Unknown Function [uncultured bacterium]